MNETTYKVKSSTLPFLVELPREVILTEIQSQVETKIDPESLTYDPSSFVWSDGQIAMTVTFKDDYGYAYGKVYIEPNINKNQDVGFLVDAEFLGYFPAIEGLN